jgi:hypothetical protein
VYGIEEQNFSSGIDLSPPVQAVMQEVVEQVIRDVLSGKKM